MDHQYYHQDHHHQQQYHNHYDQDQSFQQQSNPYQPRPYIDRYASYEEQNHHDYPTHPPPPPANQPSNHHYPQQNQNYPEDHSTYPPDQYYHSDETYHHPDYDPAYGLDEKYPPAELFPPHTSTRPLHESNSVSKFDQGPSSSFPAPTRGSVAAQMAAEGSIPEKAGLRMWRSDEHSGAFTRGGKSKSCGRCCCCTSIIIVLTIIGIIAGFLLWVRPPNATFNGIAPPTAGNQVDLQPNGFLLNFDLNIGVTNPNFFGASFSKIAAKAYYPLNKTAPLGGGELENVEIKPHSNTTINFPFQINYTTSLDPNKAILADIASRCGFLGSPKSPIKISFDIMLRLKVLAITISPTFSSSNTFTCPLKQSDFTSVLGPTQSLDALSNLLTGSGGGGGAAGAAAAAATGATDSQKKKFAKRSIYGQDENEENEYEKDLDEDRRIEELVLKVLRFGTSNLNSVSQLRLSSINGLQLSSSSSSSSSLSSSFSSLTRTRTKTTENTTLPTYSELFKRLFNDLFKSLSPSYLSSFLT